jgi:predicted small lipoprotein YifL
MSDATRPIRRAALAVAAVVLAGCGLKGPLTLPERATNVVIRPAPGSTATPPPAPPPAAPEEEERLPPPELPSTPRGSTGG